MDCYCHTGAFSLNAAIGGCKKVDGIDLSATAVRLAYENRDLNHIGNNCNFIVDDVEHYLDNCHKGQYDLIILDPPAFCKSTRMFEHAFNGYKKINAKAFNLLDRGDILISCSCSRFMGDDQFEKMLQMAAKEANKEYEILYVTTQSKDHPIDINMSETKYLKFYCLIIK